MSMINCHGEITPSPEFDAVPIEVISIPTHSKSTFLTVFSSENNLFKSHRDIPLNFYINLCIVINIHV